MYLLFLKLNKQEVISVSYFLPTLEEVVDRNIELAFNYDSSEIEKNKLFDPEKRFYDIEDRIDSFGLFSEIPPFSGIFRV